MPTPTDPTESPLSAEELATRFERSADWLLAGRSFEGPHVGAGAYLEAAVLLRQQAALIERLQAENQALRADAERYRWLRDAALGEIVFDYTASQSDGGNRFELRVPFDGHPIENDEESARALDAAIDAALDAAMKDHR